MKLRSIVELTPLLDVFLILIFAFIIKAKSDINVKQQDVAQLKQTVAAQQDSISQSQAQIAAFRKNLDSSEIRTLQLEAKLIEREIKLQQSIASLSQKLAAFFGTTELELGQMVQDGELSEEDFEYFQQQIEQFTPAQNPDIIRKIYTMTELEAYSSIFDIYLNAQNEVLLFGEPTGLMLRDYDEQLDGFPEGQVTAFEDGLIDKLEMAYRDKERSKERLGDVVMITFGYSYSAMRGAIKLTDRTIDDFFRDLELRERTSRKIIYTNLGYYPSPAQ